MKIDKAPKLYLVQLIIALVSVNLTFLASIYIVGEIQKNIEFSEMEQYLSKIEEMKQKNTNSSTQEVIIKSIEATQKSKFSLLFFDNSKKLRFKSSKFNIDTNELQKNLISNTLSPYTYKYYRIRKKPSGFFVFHFDIPPRPSLELLEESSPLQRLEVLIFFVFLITINLTMLIGFIINKNVTDRFLKTKTTLFKDILEKLKSGKRGMVLTYVGHPQIDKLVDLFNSVIKQFESDIKELNLKDEELKNLIEEISHDFKTPLSSIQILSQNTINHYDKLDKTQREKNLNIIESEISFLTKMVETLLFISNISTTQVANENVDLTTTIHDEVNQRELEKIKIECNTENNTYFPIANIYAQRLIKNLLDNAISNATSLVRVELTSTEQGLTLKVQNDGNRIENKDQYGVRNKSRKIDLTNGINISMGLGSVIITKIIKKYNGIILIEDLTSSGTQITIKFPINLVNEII